VLAFGFAQMRQAKARQQAVEDAAVQLVDARPAQFTAAHALHGGLVAVAPGQGEGVGVHLGVERLHLAHDAAVPVDHSAEDVEGEHLHIGEGGLAHAGVLGSRLA
jgi:hypothetical protein